MDTNGHDFGDCFAPDCKKCFHFQIDLENEEIFADAIYEIEKMEEQALQNMLP